MYYPFYFFLQNLFHSHRKKEALQLKRNNMQRKIPQRQIFVKDDCAYRQSQINKTTRQLNLSKCAGVLINNDIKIKARNKSVAIKQLRCQNSLCSFAVTQDENGVVILHEQ